MEHARDAVGIDTPTASAASPIVMNNCPRCPRRARDAAVRGGLRAGLVAAAGTGLRSDGVWQMLPVGWRAWRRPRRHIRWRCSDGGVPLANLLQFQRYFTQSLSSSGVKG